MRLFPLLLTLSLGTLSLAPAQAAPVPADIEKTALRLAASLDGVLRNCPASYAKIGTPDKRCVGLSGTVEQARTRLGSALGGDLYGVWRSRDDQRSVYNWVKAAGGYVYVRLQADPDGRAGTLAYLDLPPETAAPASEAAPTAPVTAPAAAAPAPTVAITLTPAAKPAPTNPTPTKPTPAPAPKPAAKPASTTAAPAPSLAPFAFRRTLSLQAKRMNGEDVRAVQNRLIALMRPARPGQGDGWYGPVTTNTVKHFQAANGLPVTGVVDRATWDRLFSAAATPFTPPAP